MYTASDEGCGGILQTKVPTDYMVLLNSCVTCGTNCPLMVQTSYIANPITGTIVAAFQDLCGAIGTNYIALYPV